jgi:hypothetical protein
MRSVRDTLCSYSLLVVSLLLTSCGAVGYGGGNNGGGGGGVAPSITTQPASQTVTVGQTATFTVGATGTAPLTYQWQKNGAAISGATSSNYTTPVVAVTDNGSQFDVVVSNSVGMVTSATATLTLNSPPTIAAQPAAQSVFIGESARFTVSAAGLGPLSYQWSKNGVSISGGTNATYITPPATIQDDGASFAVTITNPTGVVTSASAMLLVGPTATTFKTFRGVTENLFAWPGKKIAVLTLSQNLDPAVMRKMIDGLDAAWVYYEKTTGNDPYLLLSYRGLDLIAEVPTAPDTACGGAACSYVGSTGTEIMSQYLQILYNDIAQANVYDQVLFYEFGRNFWFYPLNLSYQPPDDNDCVVTGYAVFMRYASLEGIGLTGGFDAYKGLNGAAGYEQILADTQAIVDTYVGNTTLTWANTLKVGNSPDLGCTDLFASFVLRLKRDYGGEGFVQKIWKEAAQRPVAGTTQTAVDNFILAASAAANNNLTALFETTWRWPVSSAAKQEATTRWGPP